MELFKNLFSDSLFYNSTVRRVDSTEEKLIEFIFSIMLESEVLKVKSLKQNLKVTWHKRKETIWIKEK